MSDTPLLVRVVQMVRQRRAPVVDSLGSVVCLVVGERRIGRHELGLEEFVLEQHEVGCDRLTTAEPDPGLCDAGIGVETPGRHLTAERVGDRVLVQHEVLLDHRDVPGGDRTPVRPRQASCRQVGGDGRHVPVVRPERVVGAFGAVPRRLVQQHPRVGTRRSWASAEVSSPRRTDQPVCRATSSS
jgi:hypothetical protein